MPPAACRLPPAACRLPLAVVLLLLSTRSFAQESTERDDVQWLDDTQYYFLLDDAVETPESMVDDALT